MSHPEKIRHYLKRFTSPASLERLCDARRPGMNVREYNAFLNLVYARMLEIDCSFPEKSVQKKKVKKY